MPVHWLTTISVAMFLLSVSSSSLLLAKRYAKFGAIGLGDPEVLVEMWSQAYGRLGICCSVALIVWILARVLKAKVLRQELGSEDLKGTH